ncbi:hypothetical protein JXD38_09410, partial [candidate division WOR-3 bacterium]|nr:hypothetical protein [candidate division WOR-3 bacterium]
VRKAEAAQRVLAVGHTAVYSADIGALKSRLAVMPHAAGRRAIAERTSSGPAAVSSSLALAAPVGQRVLRPSSILFDLCPHDIALAILLFGTPIAARAGCRGRSVEYEIRFAAGEALEGRAEWREPPHVRRFEVTGTNSSSGNSAPGPDRRDVRDTPLGRQCLDFIECCRTGMQPLSSGRLGLAVVRCLTALASSCADSGTWAQVTTELRMMNAELRTAGTEPLVSETGVRA